MLNLKKILIDTLRSDPKNVGFTLALDMINRKRKEKGEEPILDEDLGPNETTAGRISSSA